MPRVKPKRRIADRRTESALFSMDIFDDVMAEIAAASSSAALATDTGAAGAARGALLGGDCLGALGSIRCLQAASSLKEQNNALLKLKADMNNYLSGKDLTSAENGSKVSTCPIRHATRYT